MAVQTGSPDLAIALAFKNPMHSYTGREAGSEGKRWVRLLRYGHRGFQSDQLKFKEE